MATCLKKSCSFGLLRVPFVNCCQFMYLVISLLVLRAGYGIWLYQFLIIAYLFTLKISPLGFGTYSKSSEVNFNYDYVFHLWWKSWPYSLVLSSVFGQAHRGSTVGLLLLQFFSVGLAGEFSSCIITVLNLDLYVCFVLMHWCVEILHADWKTLIYVDELQNNLGRGLLERKTG